jgi:hypothetical protein
MRRIHLIVGLLGVVIFVLTGQIMARHTPPVRAMEPELRLMYVSRHIYLLCAALVNLIAGLYLRVAVGGWQRAVQFFGSVLLLLSPALLTLAFLAESPLGLAGRSWRSSGGIYTLFGGTLLHALSQVKTQVSAEN